MQSLPRPAESYAEAQRAQTAAVVATVQRGWRRMDPDDVTGSWTRVRPSVLAMLTAAQVQAAAAAQAYVPSVLAATGQQAADRPSAAVRTAPLVGVAGDGRDLGALMDGAAVGARQALAEGATGRQALAGRLSWLSMVVSTVLADTRRGSESLAIGVRPVAGYVRMLVPPSCSRCVILAGKWFRKNQGFQRHPHCDCAHIPAAEASDDLTVNPAEYFDSLSEAQQDRVFTKAGADAIRDGADMNQVVNARRGMGTAQNGGQKVLVTTEGTTRRGWAHSRLGTSAGGGRRPRLMPETIAQVATDHQDYLRLLRANHYIF